MYKLVQCSPPPQPVEVLGELGRVLAGVPLVGGVVLGQEVLLGQGRAKFRISVLLDWDDHILSDM